MLNFFSGGLGHGCWYGGGGGCGARACLFACVRVSVCDANRGWGRWVGGLGRGGGISLWLYLVNAAAADKSFISLVLRYRPRRPCYTLPLQFTQSAQHKDTATPLLPPPPPAPLFLPSSLLKPPPPRPHPSFASPFPSPPRLVTQGNM